MLTIPARARPAIQVQPRETEDGQWAATLSLAGQPLRLTSPRRFELIAALETLGNAIGDLSALVAALDSSELLQAREALDLLGPRARTLRPLLIEAYVEHADSPANQLALGLVCLAAGRWREARFHLLRGVPGQPERFAFGGALADFRWHPDARRAMVRAASAMQLVGQANAAHAILLRLRQQLEITRIQALVQTFPKHVLWTRADVLSAVRGVIQIGANVGDESPLWARLGIPHLLAFEPIPAAFATLSHSLSAHAPAGSRWQAEAVAVADTCGSLEFWCGEQSGNSSFLELNPQRSDFHQANRHSHRITVETTTLDAFFAARPSELDRYNLIFMDVQGAEHLVIKGAVQSLQTLDFVCMELSETEIYTGTWTIARMDQLMREHGFSKIAQEPNEWPEQVDAIYARNDLIGC